MHIYVGINKVKTLLKHDLSFSKIYNYKTLKIFIEKLFYISFKPN